MESAYEPTYRHPGLGFEVEPADRLGGAVDHAQPAERRGLRGERLLGERRGVP